MPSFDTEWLLTTLMLVPPLLFSLTVHEFAHARTALAFGDPTARMHGRVSLNPLVHLDPIGTLVLILSGFFGWAKPVPVNPANLEPRRLGDIAVSAAGPLSNLGLAVLLGLAIRILWSAAPPHGESRFLALTYLLLAWTMTANVGLFLFNLIPLFPLDGHHVAREMLPWQHQAGFMDWQMRYGRVLLIGVIIGPRLLRHVLRREIFSPLLWACREVVMFLGKVMGIEHVLRGMF